MVFLPISLLLGQIYYLKTKTKNELKNNGVSRELKGEPAPPIWHVTSPRKYVLVVDPSDTEGVRRGKAGSRPAHPCSAH